MTYEESEKLAETMRVLRREKLLVDTGRGDQTRHPKEMIYLIITALEILAKDDTPRRAEEERNMP